MRFQTLAFDPYVASLKHLRQRLVQRSPALAYALTVAAFVWVCAHFYIPGKGFTYLISFGSLENARYLPELRATNHYEAENSLGYDGVYYAQIAMRPVLDDPVLNTAVDSLPYRARRILLPALANLLAGGDPVRALHVYAVLNIACWFGLAFILLRWFPPNSWGNFFRWFGVLGSYGVCFSVRSSLLDGPSLFLIAAAMLLTETGRHWAGALLMGVGGLAKDTNLIAATGLPLPSAFTYREWAKFVIRGVLVIAPLFLWMYVLWLWIGTPADPGARNFDWPFVALIQKCVVTWEGVSREGWGAGQGRSAFLLISLITQCLLLVVRPRWRDPWWRLGASYAVLMAFLGEAVWEGEPGAASRVLLPLGLAFNILLPLKENPRWWLALILGNLTVLSCAEALDQPGVPRVRGPRELVILASTGDAVEARFDPKEWFAPEHTRREYWRWTRGNASVVLHNPFSFPLVADLRFDLQSNDPRQVSVRRDGATFWRGAVERLPRHVKLPAMVLPPGDTLWHFETDQPAKHPANGDPRQVAFCVRNLAIDVISRGPE